MNDIEERLRKLFDEFLAHQIDFVQLENSIIDLCRSAYNTGLIIGAINDDPK